MKPCCTLAGPRMTRSDRGESRLGYQTSGSPKGGPFCFVGCSLRALIPIAASTKSLRSFTIGSSRHSAHYRLSDQAVQNTLDSTAEESLSTSLNLTFASALG
jgi:hypothetical protein